MWIDDSTGEAGSERRSCLKILRKEINEPDYGFG